MIYMYVKTSEIFSVPLKIHGTKFSAISSCVLQSRKSALQRFSFSVLLHLISYSGIDL